MSLPETTLTQLQILMQQNPALRAQVQGAADADQAACQIAAAASANGIAVSEADLKRYFAQASQATPNQALSDAQLDAVAGGGLGDAIAEKRYSILMIRHGGNCGNTSEKPWKNPDFDRSNPLGLQ
ncbi:MAG: hypothetical protein FD135_2070 [Comamonadaceae bacterium]|nr:MAG: hypothetical protein FD135_2070 [Comamonadaceae bacterium]